MRPDLLPLFPLGVVLFPGVTLPLHIFEERYREMMRVVLAERIEFGVVLANQKGIANCGCTATVEEILQRYEDGRLDILTVGRRRFEIESLDDELPYLRARIELYDDEDQNLGDPEARSGLVKIAQRLQPDMVLDPASPRLSFDVARHVEDVEIKQVVLTLRSEAERIEHLAKTLPRTVATQVLTDKMRTLAPKNGHSKHLKTSGD
ncbi:MAG: LON peptidase substrate-binding domain-containing protein [Acidobacteria bacterium]|nr:LON peptidase substrate-binding domain-containing protein [Acidobacteriota bacterium]